MTAKTLQTPTTPTTLELTTVEVTPAQLYILEVHKAVSDKLDKVLEGKNNQQVANECQVTKSAITNLKKTHKVFLDKCKMIQLQELYGEK